MKFKLDGVDDMKARMKSISRPFPDRVGAALYQEAQIEMTESKRRVPVDTGVLRASGFVSPPVRRGTAMSVELGYGGAATYAIYVHENLDAFHRIGQAKYLESVLNESRPHMQARVARRLTLK